MWSLGYARGKSTHTWYWKNDIVRHAGLHPWEKQKHTKKTPKKNNIQMCGCSG